jgi:hypothetical protein
LARLNPDMPLERMGCVVERQKPFVTGTDGLGKMTQERWDAVATALGSVGIPVDAKGAWVE